MKASRDFQQLYQQTMLTGDLSSRIGLLIDFGVVCAECGCLLTANRGDGPQQCQCCRGGDRDVEHQKYVSPEQ